MKLKMTEEQNRRKLQSLSNQVLKLARNSTDGQHFTDLVRNAEHNGLLYLAGIASKDDVKEYWKATESWDRKKIFDIGSEEFFSEGLAGLYIDNTCGCDTDILNEQDLELAKYGHVARLIEFDSTCGREGRGELFETIRQNYTAYTKRTTDLKNWFKKPMEEKVRELRNAVLAEKNITVPSNLTQRIHFIPLSYELSPGTYEHRGWVSE